MCCRKHTREMCPNLRRLLQGFGMQVEEPMMLKISGGNKIESAKRVILQIYIFKFSLFYSGHAWYMQAMSFSDHTINSTIWQTRL